MLIFFSVLSNKFAFFYNETQNQFKKRNLSEKLNHNHHGTKTI
jgi:hypothetical protein